MFSRDTNQCIWSVSDFNFVNISEGVVGVGGGREEGGGEGKTYSPPTLTEGFPISWAAKRLRRLL